MGGDFDKTKCMPFLIKDEKFEKILMKVRYINLFLENIRIGEIFTSGARKYYSLKYKKNLFFKKYRKFLQSCFFFIFRAWKVPS